MDVRLIPLVPVALVTTACSPSRFVGDWTADELVYEGETYELPWRQRFDGAALEIGFGMHVEPDGAGVLHQLRTTLESGVAVAEAGSDHPFVGMEVEPNLWDVEVPDYNGLALTCAAGRDRLTCTGATSAGRSWGLELARYSD